MPLDLNETGHHLKSPTPVGPAINSTFQRREQFLFCFFFHTMQNKKNNIETTVHVYKNPKLEKFFLL